MARDAGGDALANTTIGVQFQLHQGTAVGTVVYSETHSPTTNDLGLFSLEVGNGTPGTGTFAAIDWSAGPYFLEVGMDPAGGSSYTSVGTQQLLSVPYALHAKTADMADDGDWVLSGDTVHSNGRRVGIGTSAPSRDLDVEGSFQLKDGTQGDKKILTSDADGNASWQELSGESLLGAGNVPPAISDDLSCFGIAGSLGIGTWPGSVAVAGDHAYVVDFASGGLQVIDISSPDSPVLSGSLGVGSLPVSVAVSGNYAYVVGQGAGDLKVIDISSPASPVLSGSLGVGPAPACVAVSGNYAYVVGQGTSDLKVIDISSPSSPVLTGSLGVGSDPIFVAVSGNYAYVVDIGSDDLKVIDVSSPTDPVLTGSLGIGTFPVSVSVSGNYAYVIDSGTDDLKVIDVSSPASPALIGSIGIGTEPFSLVVSSSYAYVVDRDADDLKVIDISSPTSPVLSSSLLIGPDPRSVAVLGNHAYVVDQGSDDLKVIELSCPSAQQQLAYDPVTGAFVAVEGWQVSADTLHNGAKRVGIGTASPDTTLHVAGKLKYQDGSQADKRILTSDADGNASWQELSAAGLLGAGNVPAAFSDDLSCLGIAGSVGVGPVPTSMTVSGSYAYVVDITTDDLKVIDISNPASPALSGSLGIGSNPRSIAVSGNYVYIVDIVSHDLKVIDISNPASPVLSGSLVVGTSPRSVTVSGNYAYIVDYSSDDLKVIDISNPVSPVLSGSVGIGPNPISVTISGGYAYVVDDSSFDLKVIDISSPASPVLSGSLGIGMSPVSVAVSGNYAYVVDTDANDLKVIDISTPTNPVLSGSLAMGTLPNSVAISGSYAYVVDRIQNDLKVIDISSPASPALAGSLVTGSSPAFVAVSGNHAYVVANGSDDLMVIELFCPTAQQQLTYDPSTGAFVAVEGWQLNADTLYTLDKKVGIGISDPNSLLAGTDIGLVDDAGEHARLTLKSNAVKGVLDARSTPGVERMQLGSVSAHPLSFFTSGSLQMTLDTNGFLGIGTATPAHGLDLRANGQAFGHRSLDSTIAVGTYVDNANGAFLQTHTDHPLQFATNNGNAQMTLLQNGNVGIGSSTPIAKLHIAGTSAGIRLQDTDDGSALDMIAPDPTSGSTGGIGTFGAFDLPLFTDNSDRMTIKADGKVGIGTAAPSALLDVRDASSSEFRLSLSSSHWGKFRFSASEGLRIEAKHEGNQFRPMLLIGSELKFYSGSGTTPERMRLASNGYLGIGTDAPSAKLHSSISASPGATILQRTGLFLDNEAQNGTFPNSPNEVALVFGENGSAKQAIIGATYANDHLRFYTGSNFTDSRIAITAAGSVGIGTDGPTAKLSVNGTANNSTGSWGVFSDARVKTVRRAFTDGLSVIDRMRPVVFTYNADAPFEVEGEQVGIIAQELEELAPYMVSITEHGDIHDLREVNNQAYVFLLINAVKELSVKVDELQAENAGLRNSDADLRAQLKANSQLLADVQRLLDAQTSR
ncbi:MAG: tail fiber domain-containing protein [Flavobacteriales bacterium]|nr:MAG: tail fiber domain-containing protein [Flavobacteriales bacterium]